MKNFLKTSTFFLLFQQILFAQSVDISPSGVSFPKVNLSSTTDVASISSLTISQLVYNTNTTITGNGADGVGFYFWNGTLWKKLNSSQTSNATSLPTSSVVMSEIENNTSLFSSDFGLIGKVTVAYQPYSTTPQTGWINVGTLNNAPVGRSSYASCVVDGKMLVWGGSYYSQQQGSVYTNTGGLYSASTDTWTVLPTFNSFRVQSKAICFDKKAIIYGGRDAYNSFSLLNTGHIYDTNSNTWTAISNTNAPSIRDNYTATWCGSKMVIWGGNDENGLLNTGAMYDPTTNAWEATSLPSNLTGRHLHTAIWTGSKMIVWGGREFNAETNSGSIFDISTNNWTAISTSNAPSPRQSHVAISTDTKMIILGGSFNGTQLTDGGVYDITTDTWTTIPSNTSFNTTFYGSLLNQNTTNPLILMVNSNGETRVLNLTTNTSVSVPTGTFSPAKVESLVSDGNIAVTWGGISYPQGTPIYNTKANIYGITNYLPTENKSLYLYKKN